ncbi:alkanesulfonate monooxygenase SsuD/methylene tetrahydromethanopterin reductase-like flavin-dependent oxidoreductase (luciferase family) [Kribbella voronezhensis]|uniref:Alkanesulfonate monooxygenase SsuD/methylene tetrahydromethanopterin reductase-like flavin-dependent oxidoreductase (Luciferase family) n=1 Tax=Kribbella voronezhensis TaxID=2512212 RepID=A0A4R7T666_9ACTN|nr:LLM class flavin-dependent oxidoreductase [Kribbella voronezhensis]TDU87314.1 alkanesulfonate monooxygenase SsuD/methylene tetrahydromethanopterin reductase-like flavin-dependent oxidoreductase (luciferase family) [Kribbella voronezhensis]
MQPSFGILHDFRQPLPHRESLTTYYTECLEELVIAEELGFDTVWMPEHHLAADGMLPSPLVMAAAIAARTQRIQIGTSILVLPLHHPLRIAEDAAVVDLLSGGRLVLGIGQGYAAEEFAAFGVERRRRAQLLEEGVAVLRQAWSGSPDFQGKNDLQVTPKPERPIPLFIGGVTKAGLERAARLGDGVIVYCATPADLLARRRLLDELEIDLPLVCTSVLHVAPDPDRAWAEAEPGIAYLEGQLAQYAGQGKQQRLNRDDYLVGTPAEVADRLIALGRELRFSQFAHWARLPGLSHARASETLRLVAAEVIPAVLSALR